jgi:hypothetical protein
MAVIVENDGDLIDLSDDHDQRVSQLSFMFFEIMLKVCNETDTNFCELAVSISRQSVGNMILNGHHKCAKGMIEEVQSTVAFLAERGKDETAH